jgi:hypothetical protein
MAGNSPPLTMQQAQETLQKYGIQSPTMAQPIPQTPTQSAVPGLDESAVPPPLSDIVSDWIMRNVVGSATMSGEMAGIIYGAKEGAKAFQEIPGTKMLPRQAQAMGMFTFGAAGAVMGDSLKNLFTGQGDVLDSINEGLKSGLFYGMGEGVVKGVTLAGSAISNIRKGVQPSPEQLAALQNLQSELKAYGIEIGEQVTLTMGQIQQKGLTNTLESIAKAGFGGDNAFRAMYEKQAEFIVNRVDKLVQGFTGRSRLEIGEAVTKAIQEGDEALKAWAQPKFKEIHELAGGAKISIQGTETFVRNQLAKGRQNMRSGTRLDSEVESLYKDLLQNQRNITFENLFDQISMFTAKLRQVQQAEVRNPALEKQYTVLINRLMKDARRGAEKLGNPEIMDKYDSVTGIYKETLRSLYPSTLKGLATKAPEWVGSEIAKTGNVSAIQDAFKAIDASAEFQRRTAGSAEAAGQVVSDAAQLKRDLKGGYLRQLLEGVETAEGTVGALAQLKRKLQGAEMGDTFKAMLTPAEQKSVNEILDFSDLLVQNSSGAFSLVVRGRQAGSLNQVLTQAGTGTTVGGGIFADPMLFMAGVSILTAPKILAMHALNPKTADKMLKMLRPLTNRMMKPDYVMNAQDARMVGLMLASTADYVGGSSDKYEGIVPADVISSLQVKGLPFDESLRYTAHRINVLAETGKDIGKINSDMPGSLAAEVQSGAIPPEIGGV